MERTTLFKTGSGNTYIHSAKKNQFLLSHPVLNLLLHMKKKGIDIEEWLADLEEDGLEITNYGQFAKTEVEYYYRKYKLLAKNSYFTDVNFGERISLRLTGNDVKNQLAKTMQVTFEVTDHCNLKCEYCAYGKFYLDYDKRTNEHLNINTAKKLLAYLYELWNSPQHTAGDRAINIGFYGGEPLLNFRFIEEMVAYIKEMQVLRTKFKFSMTTNALLLEKHMDFLVENDFDLLISLDGNEENNGYRVFANGKPAYREILANVLTLRRRYPGFFAENVDFNSVLHNKNSIAEIHRFFKENFDKVPSIAELNTTGIDPEKREDFWKTYQNMNESLQQAENQPAIENDLFIRLPEARDLMNVIHQYSGCVFRKYDELKFNYENRKSIPTGTCLPFSRKVFLTVNGKLLPCERIGQQYSLGNVDEKRVDIDFVSIAKKYNDYYDKLSKLCSVCYNSRSCGQCIFHLDIDDDNPQCEGFMNDNDFSNYLAARMSYLEENPGLYAKIMKEVVQE